MKFDKEAFKTAVAEEEKGLADKIAGKKPGYYGWSWRNGGDVRLALVKILKDSVSWEDDAEKEKVIEYLKTYGLKDQLERDFAAKRRVVKGQTVTSPEYLEWSAGDALERVLTYRNSLKLSSKNVEEHRSFIKEVASELLGEGEIFWCYKESEEYEYVRDRGYSLSTFPAFAVAQTYLSASCTLLQEKTEMESYQAQLDKANRKITEQTEIITNALTELEVAAA